MSITNIFTAITVSGKRRTGSLIPGGKSPEENRWGIIWYSSSKGWQSEEVVANTVRMCTGENGEGRNTQAVNMLPLRQSLVNTGPQKDVPTEVITHYIVRDYRRMYEAQKDMTKKIENIQNERDKAIKTTDEIEKKYDTLKQQLAACEAKLKKASEQNEELQAKLKNISSLIEFVKTINV